MIKVAIADDHQLILNSISRLLSEEEDISVTETALSYDQIKQLYTSLNWDVLILDIIMPVKSGFEVIAEIKKSSPAAKILFLSNLSDVEIINEAMIKGAYGFLNKSDAPNKLIEAVRIIGSAVNILPILRNEKYNVLYPVNINKCL